MNISSSAAATPRYRAWAIGLLLAMNLVNYIDRQMLAAVTTDIRHDFFEDPTAGGQFWLSLFNNNSPDFWLGLLNSAFLVTYMVVAPLSGRLADRFSRWTVIGIGVLLWSLASGGTGLATGYTMLLLTRMCVGVGEAAYGPAAPALIADLVSVRHRGTVMAWFYMAIPVGSALGYVLGGLAAQHATWRTAFHWSVLPGLLLGGLAFFTPEVSKPAEHSAEARPRSFAEFKAFLKIPSYFWNTAGLTLMTFALGGIAFWITDYIFAFRQRELEPSECLTKDQVARYVGIVTVLSGITATICGGVICDWLSRRFRGAYLSASGLMMLLAFPMFLLLLWDQFSHIWAWLFCVEFCVFFSTGPTNTALVNVISPPQRAAAVGLNILLIHLLGDVLSPPLIGGATKLANGNQSLSFMLVSLALLGAGVCWLIGSRHLAADMERIELD